MFYYHRHQKKLKKRKRISKYLENVFHKFLYVFFFPLNFPLNFLIKFCWYFPRKELLIRWKWNSCKWMDEDEMNYLTLFLEINYIKSYGTTVRVNKNSDRLCLYIRYISIYFYFSWWTEAFPAQFFWRVDNHKLQFILTWDKGLYIYVQTFSFHLYCIIEKR